MTVPTESPLEEAVIGYLAEHPHAMDTLDGIAEWWIQRQRVRVDVTELSRALERLVGRGALQRVDSGVASLYRLAQKPTGSQS
jgi:hypothetical protein